MHYTKRTAIADLKKNHETLIGWGPSILEYVTRYSPLMYSLDYLVDGTGVATGKTLCGMPVSDISILDKMDDNNICFIIYPNLETEIVAQIKAYAPKASYIVGRLVAFDGLPHSYSSNFEDRTLLALVRRLKQPDLSYIDIGVCHPVIRNNTYLLYEQESMHGVLVEPNPEMCALASLYRPNDIVLNYGASSGEDGDLQYYTFPAKPGPNTFIPEVAERRGFAGTPKSINTRNINDIIGGHFETCPDILDLDAEGMDYELMAAIDTARFNIKIVCIESIGNPRIYSLMHEKGYIHFMKTRENEIYVRKEIMARL